MKNALITLATAAFLAAVPAAAQDVPSGTYKLDPTHASLTWKINHLGLSNYTARFTNMDATITFDAEDPTKSKVVATVNPTSVETDYPNPEQTDFDAELQGEKFFDVADYSSIRFESTSLELTGETTGTMTGNLTLLGVTKPVTLDVDLVGAVNAHPYAKRPAMGFSARGTIKRSEFGMTHLIPYIGDDVEVIIEAEFIKSE